MSKSLRRHMLAVLSSAVALDACSGAEKPAGPSSKPPAVAHVEVTPDAVSLLVGASQTYVVNATDAQGASMSGRPVSWVSSGPDVASISSTGIATGLSTSLGQTATAVIVATVDGVSGSASAIVVALQFPWIESFNVSPSTIVLGSAGASSVARVNVRDAGPGVDSVRLAIVPPAGYGTSYSQVCHAQLTAGTKADGIWSCTLTWPSSSPLGRWSLSWVIAEDADRHGILYEIAAAKTVGSTSSVALISPGSDSIPPVLTGFSIADSVALGAGTTTEVAATITDAGSGIAQVVVDVGDSRGIPNVGTDCTMRPSTADSS